MAKRKRPKKSRDDRTEDPRHVPEAFADSLVEASMHERNVRLTFGSHQVDVADPDGALVRVVSCRVALTELAVGELCEALAELAIAKMLDDEEPEPGEKPN